MAGNHNDIHDDSVYHKICQFFLSIAETDDIKESPKAATFLSLDASMGSREKNDLSSINNNNNDKEDTFFHRSNKIKNSSHIILEKTSTDVEMRNMIKHFFTRLN